MGSCKIKLLEDAIANILSNGRYELSYITENADWIIRAIGSHITTFLNREGLIKSRITTTHLGLRNQIIHFGSVGTFISERMTLKIDPSNRFVLTWFHLVPNDIRTKFLSEVTKKVDIIHTACQITKNRFIELGVSENKIVVIPLGVDISLFNPSTLTEKKIAKRRLNIPSDKAVIGSFQKDGVGWRKGLKPKLIKGPDIFVRVMEKLSKDYPIFVLLVGPSRGYVEKELQKRNIPFRSIGYLKDFKKIAKYYNALDLYLITSRIEGGPKQILEAWASGIPVVSSKVGMVPDIAKDGENALLTEIEDVNQITYKTREVIENEELKKELINNGLKAVQDYSWEKISREYYNKIYQKVL